MRNQQASKEIEARISSSGISFPQGGRSVLVTSGSPAHKAVTRPAASFIKSSRASANTRQPSQTAEAMRQAGAKYLSDHAVHDPSDANRYFEKIAQQSTKPKRVVQALFDALELNRTILATSSVGMLACRAAGHCVFANQAAAQTVGGSPEQLMRMNFRQIASWKKYGLLEMADETLRTGKPQERELFIVTSFGNEVWLDTHMARFFAGGDKYLFVLHRDITGHKRVEEALRTLSFRLRRAQDHERRHIARELHDSTAQKLIGLALNLSQLEHRATRMNASIRKLVHRSLALAEDCTKEVRTLSHLLHPPLLDQLGLAAACRDHVNGFKARSGIRVRLDFPDNLIRLSAEANLAIFRVVQEGLANIHRHSGSKSATIRLRHTADQVRLEVSDCGRGFSPAALQRENGRLGQDGLGLVAMRERLSELGGRLDIETGKNGTTLRATLPLGHHPRRNRCEFWWLMTMTLSAKGCAPC